MTLAQKKQARKKLKAAFGAGFISEISESNGLSKVYIRRWFNEEIAQPNIEAEVLEMLDRISANEQKVRELLNT